MKRFVVPIGAVTVCSAVLFWLGGFDFGRPRHVPTHADSGEVRGEEIAPAPRDSAAATAAQGNDSAIRSQYLQLLEKGLARLHESHDYTAIFFKQERVQGELLEPDTTILKVRHQPFSVHLKWTDGRKEVVYVSGQNRNKLTVFDADRPRGLCRLNLDPDGFLAMSESRYPITRLGLAPLAQTLIEYRRRDAGLRTGVQYRTLANATFDGRDCHGFVVDYASPSVEPVYRKSIAYIDKETLVPVFIKNYGWPEDEPASGGPVADADTLIEHYTYRAVRFDKGLSDGDFLLESHVALAPAPEK